MICPLAMPLIEADELQIEQVLHNLLRNAVEAMPTGDAPAGDGTGAGGHAEISICRHRLASPRRTGTVSSIVLHDEDQGNRAC
jgi:signal transduction histidine kinase